MLEPTSSISKRASPGPVGDCRCIMNGAPQDMDGTPGGANGFPSGANGAGDSRSTVARAPKLAISVREFTYGRILGTGSYSKVLLAIRKSDRQEYALKVMSKQLIVREKKALSVKRERMILDQLQHPGIVKMHFTFQDASNLYMAMECCHGGELFDQIRLKGKLSIEDARFYAAEVLCALEYLHSRGVLHRDLKPENVLLSESGHVKLVDFGTARVVAPLSSLQSSIPQEHTELPLEQAREDGRGEGDRNGSFVGTAEYISPEVLNSNPASFESDLWAFGCILFQMLEGRPPFRGKSEYLTFQKILNREYSLTPDLDPDARDLIQGFFQLDPSQRLGSVARGGYRALKQHPFFQRTSIDATLWEQAAPQMVIRVKTEMSQALRTGENTEADEEWEIASLGGSLLRKQS